MGDRRKSARAGSIGVAVALAALAGGASALADTIPTNFQEYGTQVSGYQDRFPGTSLDPAWTVAGTNVYTVSGGFLHIGAPTTDPAKLLYQGASYDGVVQNVLVLANIISASGTDCRMGATASNTTAGQGVNVMFRGNETLDNFAFLNDYVAHGPQNNYPWALNTPYWIRLLHSPNKTGGTDPLFNGTNDCFGKVWPADGTTAEPANYQFAWASNDSRSGYAGIQSGAYYGASQWDVGYVLIQASGLPTINIGPPAPVSPPAAPTNLTANYTLGIGVSLAWTDNSSDESAFQVERAPGTYAFSLLTSKAANSTSHLDTLLYPATTYRYRVRATNANGNSEYSNEASITTNATETIPAPPDAPNPLSAAFLGTSSVVLTWGDNSPDEVGFDLERADAGDPFRTVVSPKANVTSFAEHTLHRGWLYTYKVRALSLQGASLFSNPVTATLPATLTVTVISGTVTDTGKVKGDKVKVVAAYAPVVADPTFAFNPVSAGIDLRVGAANAPVLISIPAGDKTWKVKKSKFTWKSKKGVFPKVTVVVDTTKRTVTATVTGATFSAAPTSTVRTLVSLGSDGGGVSSSWTVKKPGVLVFK